MLAGYTYRKKITIAGQTGAGTNYQVKLLVGESVGATGEQFHLSGHSSSFPSAKNVSGDLRFTASDGDTLLDFWVESVTGTTPNRLATVWVEVSADLGTNQSIYCYYDGDATNVSNGDNTFLFFDDFDGSSIDTAKWTVGGTMTQASSSVSGTTSITDYLFGKTRINIDTSTVIKMQNKTVSGTSARPGVLQSAGNPYNIPGFGWQDYENTYRYTDTFNSAVEQIQNTVYTTDWYLLESKWNSTGVKFYVDGSLYQTHTIQIPASTLVLYGQVEGNAYYDYFYTRKAIETEPSFLSASSEPLLPNTTYRVRAYATNSAGTSYGETVSFTTLAAPTVTTQSVTNITATTATGNGNVTADGGATITERGVCWSTSTGPTTASSKATASGTTGAYTVSITGLSDNTIYYARAYAVNSVGTSYGTEVIFANGLTTGMISYWKLDESSGNAEDSILTNDGANTDVTYSTGLINNAGVFNGTTSKLTITDDSSLKPTAGATVSAWIKTTDTSTSPVFFQSWSYNPNIAGIRLVSPAALSGKVRLFLGSNVGNTQGVDSYYLDGSVVINDDDWHHVVGTFDGAIMNIYVDGTLDISYEFPTKIGYDTTNYVRIGTGNNSGIDTQFFTGTIDEVGLWGRALSSDEITYLYNSGAGIQYPFAVANTGNFFQMF